MCAERRASKQEKEIERESVCVRVCARAWNNETKERREERAITQRKQETESNRNHGDKTNTLNQGWTRIEFQVVCLMHVLDQVGSLTSWVGSWRHCPQREKEGERGREKERERERGRGRRIKKKREREGARERRERVREGRGGGNRERDRGEHGRKKEREMQT